jgi:hypothetical protein
VKALKNRKLALKTMELFGFLLKCGENQTKIMIHKSLLAGNQTISLSKKTVN